MATRAETFPVGAAVTLEELESDPHPVLARLREREPVSWLPCLDGWLLTRHDLVVAAMRDATTFTVDDPRFSTARVVGPSMLSLDGEEHALHRAPFVGPFRPAAVRERFGRATTEEAERLLDGLATRKSGELRRGFAGPISAAIVTRALGLARDEVDDVLSWYDAIVASVTEITAGHGPTEAGEAAFASLEARMLGVIADRAGGSLLAAAAADSTLSEAQVVSNAAVLLFGGIETTEGMIANAALMLLERPEQLALARTDPAALDAALDESLRLEPAAAVIDRYATADVELGGARIARGDLVRISLAGANRDPAVFPDPDTFDLGRSNRRHLAFAQGPHVCVGVHLARLEARIALAMLLRRLPGLRLDPARPAVIRGLVFRKPPRLDALW
jgi:cytochrome P450